MRRRPLQRVVWPIALMLLALPAMGAEGGRQQVFTPRFEITPWGGYRFGGSFDYDAGEETSTTFDLGDASSWGVGIGLYRDVGSFYELLFSTQSALLDTGGASPDPVRLRTEYYHLGGTLLFEDRNGFVPWLSMTVGATRFDPVGTLQGSPLSSESAFSLSLGGGLRVPLNRHFSIVGGVRGYVSFIDSSSSLFCISSGGAACAFRISGSSFLQFEGLLGLALTF